MFLNQTNYWIGAKVQATTSSPIWLWNQYNSVLNYTDWKESTPSDTNPPLGNCAAGNTDDGTWSVKSCQESYPFVCQIPTVINEYSCESGWTYYDNTDYCYKVFPQKDIVQDDAHRNCRNVDAHLISIHSDAENSFLAELTSIRYHEDYHREFRHD